VRYYSWFSGSGLGIAEHRGYGQTASRLWGLVGAPRLSVPAMAASGALLVACLALPSLPLVPAPAQAACFGLALVFYHLYFSQLYCEAHVGAHVTVMVPPVLVLLALSPGLSNGGNPDGSPALLEERAGAFTAWLVKIVLASAYCSAGASKVASSVRARRAWWDGATLQASVFEALLLCRKGTHSSFGVPTPFAHEVQAFAYRRPRLLLAPASFLSVALEALAPLVLLLPPSLASRPFAVVGISFHYGIAYLQNVDFVSWWGPAYAFFLLDPAAAPGAAPELFGPLGAARAALELAPVRASLALAYVAAHIVAMLVLHFCPGVEILPFSCFPMFKNLQDLFSPATRKWVWLTDKGHHTGTLKNYCFPFCRPQRVETDELDRLPFRYLLLGHGGSNEEVLHANFEVSSELRELLWRIRAEGCCGDGVYANDPEAADRLLGLLLAAQAAFDRCGRAAGGGYCPPPAPALAAQKQQQCPTRDSLMETESTVSASDSSVESVGGPWGHAASDASRASAERGAAGKLAALEAIGRSLHGQPGACSGEGPLRVLCTDAETFQEVTRTSSAGMVAATLLTDDPAEAQAARRQLRGGHSVVCARPEEAAGQLAEAGRPFDAVLAKGEALGRLPQSVLSRGSRIILV